MAGCKLFILHALQKINFHLQFLHFILEENLIIIFVDDLSFLLTCKIYFLVHKHQHLQLQIYLSFHFIYIMFNDKMLVLLQMRSKPLFQEYSSSTIKWLPWQFIVVQMNMIFSVFVCVWLCESMNVIYVWVCVYVWFFVWEPVCVHVYLCVSMQVWV